MIQINIASDFSKTPGARNYSDGPYSGEEFYHKVLSPKFKEAINENSKLEIILDGTAGYASSFLNESFRLLGKEYGAEVVWQNLIIISNEVPKYIQKIKEALNEK